MPSKLLSIQTNTLCHGSNTALDADAFVTIQVGR